MKTLRAPLLAVLACTAATVGAVGPEAEKYWHQWRGPHATGVAPHATPPLEWS
jgi:hypothetical protein